MLWTTLLQVFHVKSVAAECCGCYCNDMRTNSSGAHWDKMVTNVSVLLQSVSLSVSVCLSVCLFVSGCISAGNPSDDHIRNCANKTLKIARHNKWFVMNIRCDYNCYLLYLQILKVLLGVSWHPRIQRKALATDLSGRIVPSKKTTHKKLGCFHIHFALWSYS